MAERFRQGRKVGRTLYVQDGAAPADTDRLIGLVDTPELAARIVRAVNRDTAGAELGRHEDDRGAIADLLGQVDAVTEIFTRAGAIRGNHVHQHTTQWVYVVAGVMTFARVEDDGVHTLEAAAGELITEEAGVPHAWRAETDTVVLVFTRGPRSGEAYESDTTRLPENARLLA